MSPIFPKLFEAVRPCFLGFSEQARTWNGSKSSYRGVKMGVVQRFHIKNINEDLKETLNLVSHKKYPKTIPEKQKGLVLRVANPLIFFGVPNRI